MQTSDIVRIGLGIAIGATNAYGIYSLIYREYVSQNSQINSSVNFNKQKEEQEESKEQDEQEEQEQQMEEQEQQIEERVDVDEFEYIIPDLLTRLQGEDEDDDNINETTADEATITNTDEATITNTDEATIDKDKIQKNPEYLYNIDDLLSNLKCLAQLKENEKLTICDGKISIDQRYLQGAFRWWYNESRDNTFDTVSKCIHTAEQYLISSSNIDKKIFDALVGCLSGLHNLKITYASDTLFCYNIDSVITKIKRLTAV